jgi:hypothetical protein
VAAPTPFAPETVRPSLEHSQDVSPQVSGECRFSCSFNPSFAEEAERGHAAWTPPYPSGVTLGPCGADVRKPPLRFPLALDARLTRFVPCCR